MFRGGIMRETSAGIPGTIPELAAGDVAQFRTAVAARYGFVPDDAYAVDMIAFVDACLAEVKALRAELATLSRPHVLEMARDGFQRVLDPDSQRFLFEYDPERQIVLWRNRGKVIPIDLKQYKAQGVKP